MLSRPARLRRTDSCAGSPCAAHGVFRSPKKKKKRKGQTRGRPKEGELPAWLIFLILLRAPSAPPPLLPNLGPGNVCGGPDSFSSQENCVACDKGAKLTLPCSWPEAIFYFVCSPKKKKPCCVPYSLSMEISVSAVLQVVPSHIIKINALLRYHRVSCVFLLSYVTFAEARLLTELLRLSLPSVSLSFLLSILLEELGLCFGSKLQHTL